MFILETVLRPIVWLMQLLLDFYVGIFSSTGASILLLSFSFALLLLPLQRIAMRTELRIAAKMKTVEAEVDPLKAELKGEALFLATEKIYQQHGCSIRTYCK